MRRAGALAIAMVLATTATLHAQRGRGGLRGLRPGRARAGMVDSNGKTQALRRQVREAFGRRVRTELQLNDDQWSRLQDIDRRYQQKRGTVLRGERQARQGLAALLQDTTHTTDKDAKVAQYMDQLVQAQHQRADLLDSEQKEMAEFLTPVQRAKYFALRDQLNRRIAQMLQQNGGRGAPPPQP